MFHFMEETNTSFSGLKIVFKEFDYDSTTCMHMKLVRFPENSRMFSKISFTFIPQSNGLRWS